MEVSHLFDKEPFDVSEVFDEKFIGSSDPFPKPKKPKVGPTVEALEALKEETSGTYLKKLAERDAAKKRIVEALSSPSSDMGAVDTATKAFRKSQTELDTLGANVGRMFGEGETATKRLKESLSSGMKQNELAALSLKARAEGGFSEDDEKIARELEKKIRPKSIVDRELPEDIMNAAIGFLPSMGAAAKDALKYGLISATAAAATGSLPLIAPAAVAGAAFGSYKAINELEGALVYRDLIKKGVPHDIANVSSVLHGNIAAALETAVIGRVVKRLPGVRNLFSAAIKKVPIEATVGALAVSLGKDWANNIREEVLQDLSSAVAQRVAIEAANLTEGTNIPKDTVEQIGAQLVETAKETAKGMIPLLAPGAVSSGVRIGKKRKAEKQILADLVRPSAYQELQQKAMQVKPKDELLQVLEQISPETAARINSQRSRIAQEARSEGGTSQYMAGLKPQPGATSGGKQPWEMTAVEARRAYPTLTQEKWDDAVTAAWKDGRLAEDSAPVQSMTKAKPRDFGEIDAVINGRMAPSKELLIRHPELKDYPELKETTPKAVGGYVKIIAPSDPRGSPTLPVRNVVHGDWSKYPEVKIGNRGNITIESHADVRGTDPLIREYVQAALDKEFGVPEEPGVFYRYTNNPKEIEIAKKGELKPSFHQIDKVREKGVSVSGNPAYGVFGYKYAYKITGDVIGSGFDGEPILNPKTVKPLQEKMTSAQKMSDDYTKKRNKAIESGLKRLDWTRDQYQAARNNWSSVPIEGKDFVKIEYDLPKPSRPPKKKIVQPGATSEGKQPWMMTKEEFKKKAKGGFEIHFPGTTGAMKKGGQIFTAHEHHFLEPLGYRKKGTVRGLFVYKTKAAIPDRHNEVGRVTLNDGEFISLKEMDEAGGSLHKAIVKKHLTETTPEVLKDYPELGVKEERREWISEEERVSEGEKLVALGRILPSDAKRFPRTYEEEEEAREEPPPERTRKPKNFEQAAARVKDKPWEWTAKDLSDLRPSERRAKLEKIWGPEEEFDEWFDGDGPYRRRHEISIYDDLAADLDTAVKEASEGEIKSILAEVQASLDPWDYYAYEEAQGPPRQQSLEGLSEAETFELAPTETQMGKLQPKDRGPKTAGMFPEAGAVVRDVETGRIFEREARPGEGTPQYAVGETTPKAVGGNKRKTTESGLQNEPLEALEDINAVFEAAARTDAAVAPPITSEYDKIRAEAARIAYEKLSKKINLQKRREARAIKRQGIEDAQQDPVYATMQEIVKQGGLNRDKLLATWGKDTVNELSRKRVGLVTKEGKFGLDEIAEDHGFVSDDALMSMMLDWRGLAKQGKIAAERFEEQYYDLLNEAEKEDFYLSLLEEEARIIRGMLKKSRPSALGIKKVIREKTGQVRVGELMVPEYEALKAGIHKAEIASRKAFRAGNLEGVLAEKERQRQMVIDRREKKQAREAVKKLAKDISDPVGPSVDFRYRQAIEALQAGIDPNFRSKTTINRLKAARLYFEGKPEAEVPVRLIRRLAKTTLNDMTISDLEQIAAQIRRLRKLGTLKRKLQLAKEKREHNRMVEVMAGLVRRGKAPKPKGEPVVASTTRRGKFVRNMKSLRATTQQPARIFDLFDGRKDFRGTIHRVFYTEVNKAENQLLNKTDERHMDGRIEMKYLKLKTGDLTKKTKLGGTEYTRDEMIDIWIGWKNPRKRMALMFGNNITPKRYNEIAHALTEKERKLGEWIISEYDSHFQRIRDTYIQYTNENMPAEEFYSPILRMELNDRPLDAEIIEELLARKSLGQVYVEKGFALKRKDIPAEFQKPIRLGAYNTWLHQVMRQERFVAYGEKIRQLRRILNDDRFRQAVRDQFGDEYYDEVKAYIDRVARPNIYKAYDGLAMMSQELRHNAAIAYLAYNFLTIGNQIPSVFLSLQDAGPMWMLASTAQFLANPLKVIRKVRSLDPQVRHQRLERELDEMAIRQYGLIKKIREEVGRPGFLGIYWMDTCIRSIAWNAIYQKELASKKSTAEAIATAQNAILRTQEGSHPKDISTLYATSEFLNWFLQFTSQLSKIFNQATYDLPSHIMKGRGNKAFMTVLGLYLSALGIWMVRNRDLPDEPEDFLDAIIDQSIDAIPVVGRVISAVQSGYSGTPAALSGIEGIAKGVMGKGRSPELKILEGLGVTLGMPVIGLRRIGRAINEGDPWELLGPDKKKKGLKELKGLKGLEGLKDLK